MRHLLRLNVTNAAEKRFRMQPLYGDGFYPVPQDLSQLALRQPVCSWYFHENAGIQPYRFHGFKEGNFPNGISFTRFRVMKKQIESSCHIPVKEEIRLSQPDTALPKCVFLEFTGQRIALRGFDSLRIHFNADRTGSFCLAQKSLNEFRRGTVTHRFAEPVSLESLPTILLDADMSCALENEVDELSMVAFAGSRSASLQVRDLIAELPIGFGLFPDLDAFLRNAVFLKVFRIRCPARAIHRPLQTANVMSSVFN